MKVIWELNQSDFDNFDIKDILKLLKLLCSKFYVQPKALTKHELE